MLSTTVILALVIAGCRGETCGVFDGEGNFLGDAPHDMGYISRDADRGSLLPGELKFQNVRLVSIKPGDCSVGLDADGNRLRFKSRGEFGVGNVCTLTLTVQADDGCPTTTPDEYTVRYNIEGFVKDGYELQVTFPVSKGNKLSDLDIEVSGLRVSARVEFEDGFDGVEIVPVGSSRDGLARFQARATKLLYLLDDVNLTVIAADDMHTWKAPLTIRMTEDSSVPLPEFEEALYTVRLNASDFDSSRDVYPTGMIKLKEHYRVVSFDLQAVSGGDINFELVYEDAAVGVRLSEAPKNLSSQIIILQLIARVRNRFGRESEGVTTLLIGFDGESKFEQTNSPVLCDTNDPEDLKIIVIVLSVVVVILIFVIIFIYFKYVCVKKPEPEVPCKKCSAPAPVKTRRPTPRKISEYPYPLDVMPPPLETLAETDVEEDGGERSEVKDTPSKNDHPPAVPSTSGVKTRKRSMTFRESDEESRQYREAQPEVVVHSAERKVSNESQRRVSAEEERRRRKSSVKMYRCLT